LGRGLRIGNRDELWNQVNLVPGVGDRAYVEAELRGVEYSERGTALIAFNQRTGNLIKSFGRGGIVRSGVGWSRTTTLLRTRKPAQLHVMPDNSVLECGLSMTRSTGGVVSYLLRVRPDGSRDPGFGTRGELVIAPAIASPDFTARGGCESVTADDSGRIVAAGRLKLDRRHAGSDSDGFVSTWIRRFHPDGLPDDSFGAGGVTYVDAFRGRKSAGASGDTSAIPMTPRQMHAAPDGSVLIAGWTQEEDRDGDRRDLPAALRLLPNGELDPGYGTSGVFSSSRLAINNPSIEPDGGVVFPGSRSVGSTTRGAILRITPQGHHDTTLGDGGIELVRDKSIRWFNTMFGATRTSKCVVWGAREVKPYGKYKERMSEELYWLKTP